LLIFLEGDQITASSWVLFAKRKLLDLKASMARMGQQVATKRFKINNNTDISIKSVLGLDEIKIKVESVMGGLFIADKDGAYEYHGDLDHYRYGLKSFNRTLGLKKWFDPWAHLTWTDHYPSLAGVSYNKGKVYTVDEWGLMNVFKADGAFIQQVILWSLVNPTGGKSQNYIHVRDNQIFVSANYNGNFYRVYKFDSDFNYLFEYPGPYGQASWGSVAIAADITNNRLYIGNDGYYIGEHYEILVHDLTAGTYLGSFSPLGGEDVICGDLCIFAGTLYSADGINRRIIKHDLATGDVLGSIDCNPYLPSWITLRAVRVDETGIWISAYKNTPLSTERYVYIKKIALDGSREIIAPACEWMGAAVPGTDPAKALRFGKPGWMDMKNSENK